MGDSGQSQIMGSLRDYAIPKSRGFWAAAKRYVGHVAFASNSRAQPCCSPTCAPFAPTMSVHIFGHFLPFPIFLARRALWSAPPCTPDAWTNGPHIVCSLCILVPKTHTARWRTETPTHKELCQGECGQCCHSGTFGYNSAYHHDMGHGDLWDSNTCGPTLDSHLVPDQTLSPVSKPSWRRNLWGTLNFGSFFGMPKHPFFGTPFSAPHVVH